MSVEIVVPSLGESVTEAVIAQWLKKPGEAVAADEPLVELETDKVTVEVNASSAGVLSEIAFEEGAEVEVGTVLGKIDENGTASDAAPAAGSSPEPDAPAAAEAEPAPAAQAAPASEPAVAAGNGSSIDVTVPSMGESVTEGTVGQWLKQPGDTVAADEPIVEIETDKVTAEVNAPQAGTLAEVLVQEGDTVEVGTVIARLGAGGAAANPAREAAAPKTAPEPAPEPRTGDGGKDPGPAVRKLAAEHGIDLGQVPASGKDGRPTKGDVQAYIEQQRQKPAPAQTPETSQPQAESKQAPQVKRTQETREERVRMSRLRQRIAERLKQAQDTAAMLTTFNEVDMSAILEIRNQYKDSFERRHGIKLGFMSFFVKACVNALHEFPAVNAEIDGADIVYKNYYDIGVAVSTPSGLMVPVIRDCDSKGFADIEKDIVDFGTKARDGKIAMEDLQGGTFTITNGGVFGSLNSTPILNPPQSGILGMHKTQERPVAVNGAVVIRPMMNIALSYDHRIVDGREAVSFLVRVKEAIEDPQRLLLAV